VGDRGGNELVRGHRIRGCDLPEKAPKYLSRKKLRGLYIFFAHPMNTSEQSFLMILDAPKYGKEVR
jgi:hypothetical protein